MQRGSGQGGGGGGEGEGEGTCSHENTMISRLSCKSNARSAGKWDAIKIIAVHLNI